MERHSAELATAIPPPATRGRPKKAKDTTCFLVSVPNELDPDHPHTVDVKKFRDAFYSHLLFPGNSEYNFSFPPLQLHEIRQVFLLFPQFFGQERLSLYHRFQTVALLAHILKAVPDILKNSSSHPDHLPDTISFLDYASSLIRNSSEVHAQVRTNSSFPIPDFGQHDQENILRAKAAKLREDSDYLRSLHQDIKLNPE